jgi:DNA-binding transcriptional ArsR family regulator
MSDLDSTLSALADRTRRGIVELLREQPRRAGDLARQLDTSPAGLSRHLRVLRKSGLVEEEILEEDARVRIYRLRREPFDGLRSWVEQVESFWEHAERTRAASRRRKG